MKTLHPGLYLKTLTLQNFATFENQTISFDPKFNAIVGETGSGKSLILDALQIIFGARADKKLIRKNSDFSTIEAVFQTEDSEIKNYFNEIGHPFEGTEIVVKKIIYQSETAKTYLNFQSCSSIVLQNFSKRFIDLVGQFENQKLLSEDYQLILLDSYAQLNSELNDYQNLFTEFSSKQKKLQKLIEEKNLKEQREDYIKFQIREIEELNPSVEDEAKLLKQKDHLLNFEKRVGTYQAVLNLISEDETNLLSQLRLAMQKVERNPDFFSSEIVTKLNEAQALLEDVGYEISKNVEVPDEEINIDEVMDRIDSYQKLKRKFGGTTESLIENYEKFKIEASELSNFDETIKNLKTEIDKIYSSALTKSKSLHEKRVKFADKLSRELTEKVRELKMNGASIRITVHSTQELNTKGATRIEFTAETNPGEGFYKVKEIASGGELSRILLSLRQILSSNDTISVFLFDEIDTGIGGETALSIGKSLQRVSENSQVISITHLAQIANFAEKLIWVSKETILKDDSNRTISQVEEIFGNKKKEAIKAMNPI